MNTNEWYTAEQLAKFFNTSPKEIYRLGRTGKLERSRIKGKLLFRYDPQLQVASSPISRSARLLATADRLIEKYHNHPWLLSIAALCSVVGLPLALWALIPGPKSDISQTSTASYAKDVNTQIFQETPNVRATYYRMEGAILLDRAINGFGFSPADGFALRPIWLKNDVYKTLESLINLCKQGTEQTPYDMTRWYAGTKEGKELWYADVETFSENVTESVPPSAKRTDNPKEFYQGRKVRDPLKNGSGSAINIDDMISRVQTDPVWWVMSQSQDQIIPFDQFEIFGPLNSVEVSQHNSDPITKAIATANPNTNDIAFLSVYFEHGNYQSLVSVRELKLLVLDIENVGDKPIGLSSLKEKVSQAETYRLRSRGQQEASLSSATVGETAIPVELLRPNEHLFIPLSIEFGFATKPRNREIWNQEQYIETSKLPKAWWTNRTEEEIPFEIVRGADRQGNPIITIATISRSNLSGKQTSYVEQSYYIGTSIDIQEVVFKTGKGNPTPWKVRRFDPNNLIARGAFEGGSCPILFYRDPISHGLKRIGPILINAVTRHRQQTLRVLVKGNVDTFVIEETQPETSFIDQVYLEVVDESGSRSIVSPEKSGVIDQLDGNHAVLRQGHRLDIRFRIPNHIKQPNIRHLVISGYYIPDSMIRQ